MNIDSIKKQLSHVGSVLVKFRYPLIGALIVAVFAFTVYRIDTLSSPDRDEAAYNDLLLTVERFQFDEDIINEILKLDDTGIEINPNFPGSRNNPF
jgi:hypothetical protein